MAGKDEKPEAAGAAEAGGKPRRGRGAGAKGRAGAAKQEPKPADSEKPARPRREKAAAKTPPEPVPEPAAPAGLSQEAMAQLEKLADLHKSGILTDEEFAAQKARILQ